MKINNLINRKIKIITGKDRGKISKIKKIIYKTNKVMIYNINISKKNIKCSKKNLKGKIIYKEMPMDISNIKFL